VLLFILASVQSYDIVCRVLSCIQGAYFLFKTAKDFNLKCRHESVHGVLATARKTIFVVSLHDSSCF